VVRNRDKDRLLSIVLGHLSPAPDSLPTEEKAVIQGLLPGRHSRTRATVKVQDGCDGACAYCIIPRARGRSRSVEPTSVIDRVNRLVAQGHKEIVITGVDLGSYGDDRDDLPDLGGLLELVLRRTEAHRLRVSSVEPGDFNPDWLHLWADRRLCRHLHIPLQSGSDGVLKRMRRKYGTTEYMDMTEACRRTVPDLAVTTDVITGFPGETEEEFEEGLAFIDGCGFNGLHVFPYSRRPGTAAAHLPNHVDEAQKKERGAVLRALGKAAKDAHVTRNLGTMREVVWEDEREAVWRGVSDNNVRVFCADAGVASNHVDLRLLSARYADGLWGEAPDGLSLANGAPGQVAGIPLVAV